MPHYRATERVVLNTGVVVPAGATFESNDPPGIVWTPLDAEARRAKAASIRALHLNPKPGFHNSPDQIGALVRWWAGFLFALGRARFREELATINIKGLVATIQSAQAAVDKIVQQIAENETQLKRSRTIQRTNALPAITGSVPAKRKFEIAAENERKAEENDRAPRLALAEAKARLNAAYDEAARQDRRGVEAECEALKDELIEQYNEIVAALKSLRQLLDEREQIVENLCRAWQPPEMKWRILQSNEHVKEAVLDGLRRHVPGDYSPSQSALEKLVGVDCVRVGRPAPPRELTQIEKNLLRMAGDRGLARAV